MKTNVMDNQRASIDGFSVRRRTPQQQGLQKNPGIRPAIPHQYLRPNVERQQVAEPTRAPEILPRPQEAVAAGGLRRAEIDESLSAVDEAPVPQRKRKKYTSPYRRKSRKKMIALIILGLLVLGVGYFVVKTLLVGGRVFSGNLFDLLGTGTALKQDENGYSNILVFGTSEDDPGHSGAALTDSIMVISVNQEKKKAFMLSLPRDLWVDYGQACMAGYSGKINALYACGVDDGDETKGAELLKDKVGEVLGLDVQYYTKVNYSVVRDLTTAMGGVTVTIESSDPRGIYDSNMGRLLRLPNGPVTLQGEQALAFVRARGEGYGSYGFDGSNFAREKNQQKLILALRDKALSAGTLANPVAVTGMLDALGNNIRTDFTTAEVKTLTKLAEEIKENDIISLTLNDKARPLVTTGAYGGASIVRPVAGLSDYSQIQRYVRSKLVGSSAVGEEATIEILNGSSQIGVAKKKQLELEAAGLTDISIGDTDYDAPAPLRWYDTTGGGKPKTQAKLASTLGSQPTASKLPTGVQSDADFVIILGDGAN